MYNFAIKPWVSVADPHLRNAPKGPKGHRGVIVTKTELSADGVLAGHVELCYANLIRC